MPMQERFREKICSFPQVSMEEVVEVPNSNAECGLPESFFEVKHNARTFLPVTLSVTRPALNGKLLVEHHIGRSCQISVQWLTVQGTQK